MEPSSRPDQRPSFQFYPRDWVADAGLSLCSLGARGLWLELLCRMWQSPIRGVLLKQTGALPGITEIAAWARAPAGTVTTLLAELEDHDVFSRRPTDSAIVSRRMVREERARQETQRLSEKRAAAGKKGGMISGFHRRGEEPPQALLESDTQQFLPKQTSEAKGQAKRKQNSSKDVAKQTDVTPASAKEIQQKGRSKSEAPRARARATALTDNGKRICVPWDEIKNRWNEHFANTPIPSIRSFSKSRKTKLRRRWREWIAEAEPWGIFDALCRFMAQSPFHLGEEARGNWTANVDYLIRNDTRWRELLERAASASGQDREAQLRKEVAERFGRENHSSPNGQA